MSHGARKVSFGAGKVPLGGRKVSHCAVKVFNGAGKVSHGGGRYPRVSGSNIGKTGQENMFSYNLFFNRPVVAGAVLQSPP